MHASDWFNLHMCYTKLDQCTFKGLIQVFKVTHCTVHIAHTIIIIILADLAVTKRIA